VETLESKMKSDYIVAKGKKEDPKSVHGKQQVLQKERGETQEKKRGGYTKRNLRKW